MKIHNPKTVRELIQVLQQYPENASVLGTWEGIDRGIYVYQETGGKQKDIVFLDVDECSSVKDEDIAENSDLFPFK